MNADRFAYEKSSPWDFLGGLMVKTSNAAGVSLIPGWGTKTLHATWHSQKHKSIKLKKKKRKSKP